MSDDTTVGVVTEALLEETSEPTVMVSAGTAYIPVALLADHGEITVTVTTTATIKLGDPAPAQPAPPEAPARKYLGSR
jgi:hypothetical protein